MTPKFKLFRAPLSAAATSPAGACCVCGESARVRFEEACFECFRAGKVTNVVDTEFGMVRPEDAEQGVTHGTILSPEDAKAAGVELIAHPVDPEFPDETWYAAKLDRSDLIELVRTPVFLTWQGEQWLFCCGRPGIFLGEVTVEVLTRYASGSLADVVKSAFRRSDDDVRTLLEYVTTEGYETYGFECQECGSLNAYWEHN